MQRVVLAFLFYNKLLNNSIVACIIEYQSVDVSDQMMGGSGDWRTNF